MTDPVEAPNSQAGDAAQARLGRWPGAMGVLETLSRWAGSVRPEGGFARVRCVVFAADHGIEPSTSAGADARALLEGEGLLALLARRVDVSVRLVDVGLTGDPLPGDGSADRVREGSGLLDTTDALTPAEVSAAVDLGGRVADEEIDARADLLIPAVLSGAAIVPATVLIAALRDLEPVRALGFDAHVPDALWIRRCAAVRDGLRRMTPGEPPTKMLATAGGTDLAAAAGFLHRAAHRRTPALLDGVGVAAAALLAEAMTPNCDAWWLAPHGPGRAGEQHAWEALRLEPVAEFGTRLAEGAGALLALPLLTAAVELAGPRVATGPLDAT